MTYIGRFAPSPSGPLHFGSLVSAVASYLDARHHNGRWLVRMDDIDPPREMPGAADDILKTLEQHGLEWDGEVLWQSTRTTAYRSALIQLQQTNLVYPCDCTRRDISNSGGVYNGHCRSHTPNPDTPLALRLKLYQLPTPFASLSDTIEFNDLLQGPQIQNLAQDVGDAVVMRKDGLFAYQLAVVLDDIAQGITHVIRGADLLPVTARQIRFFQLRDVTPPIYGHVPVVLGDDGRKLSKQNHAAALDKHLIRENLWQALAFLRQNPPEALSRESPATILSWGTRHWQRSALTGIAAQQL
ncbi:tRNA glutamyl-Q(34) synthetase GluQRS [Gilvimarinus polysaccharolyticus]|uniref:tRNA glutamyl-Q(34) synthetase GluQRS n=1 Tax=Gilvimarinus polysaccharolyticus TaxID=863921 RepID=UPI000673B1A8|nr:tRNA glutamyl-Q(34) synthetase GluQRS [Gilvimarinus polysaccharolyticus]